MAKKLTQYTYLPNKKNPNIFTFSEQNIIKFGFCANENLMKNVKLKINGIELEYDFDIHMESLDPCIHDYRDDLNFL